MAGIATSAAVVAATSGEAKQRPGEKARQPLPQRPLAGPLGSLATASVDVWKQQVGTTFETSTGNRLMLVEVHEFAEKSGITTMRITQTYPSKDARDSAASSGMDEGMEACYQRLDAMLAQPA